jgi:phytoene dehydrogenase-like protein
VALKSGEEISAGVVSSSVDPHLTFERFIEPNDLPSDFLASVRRYKYRGSSGKVNMALDALPDFQVHAWPRRAPSWRDFDFTGHRVYGARLR